MMIASERKCPVAKLNHTQQSAFRLLELFLEDENQAEFLDDLT